MRYRLKTVHTVRRKNHTQSVDELIENAKRRAKQVVRRPRWPSNYTKQKVKQETKRPFLADIPGRAKTRYI